MKQCPACKTTYTDDTLRFCLADGNPLRDLADSQETVIQGGGFHDAETVSIANEKARAEMPRETVQMRNPAQQTVVSPPSKSSGAIFKVLMVLIGLGIFFVLTAAVGAFIYFNMNGQDRVAANTSNNKSTKVVIAESPSPTPDDSDDELSKVIANLERDLDNPKKDKPPANATVPEIPANKKMATVNSPNDGFLALRTMPSSDIGERITKIPDGATITVGFCGPVMPAMKPSGRWCQARYNGSFGWVFDAYLTF